MLFTASCERKKEKRRMKRFMPHSPVVRGGYVCRITCRRGAARGVPILCLASQRHVRERSRALLQLRLRLIPTRWFPGASR